MTKKRLIFASCLVGGFASVTQIIFAREAMVSFLGNELIISVVLGSWLMGISAGALSYRLLKGLPWIRDKQDIVLPVSIFMSGILFPVCIGAIRASRMMAGVSSGEYAPLSTAILISFASFLPVSLIIGMFLPASSDLYSRITSENTGRTSAAIYLFESAGSMAACFVITFLMIPYMSLETMVMLGSALAVTAFVVLAENKVVQTIGSALVMVLLTAGLTDNKFIDAYRTQIKSLKWRGTAAVAGISDRMPLLIADSDSKYQNLAVINDAGQFTLYANGYVRYSLRDPFVFEQKIRYVMAQNPSAKNILMIGGNPYDEVSEILKYPVEKLVYVEIDPEISELLSRATGYPLPSDKRLNVVCMDGVEYVSGCDDKYDMIIMNTGDPVTMTAGRYFTVEFFSKIKSMLAQAGFMCTFISSSARLQSDAELLGTSVYKTLKSVFDRVLVAGSEKKMFFAGGTDAQITFDAQVLMRQSREAGIPARYFRPEYFIQDDDITPEKIGFVEKRFNEMPAEINRKFKPVSTFYSIIQWNKYSSSRLDGLLKQAAGFSPHVIVKNLLYAGVLGVIAGIVIFVSAKRKLKPASIYTKTVLSIVLFATGVAAMAIEIILIYMFQSIYGYIYSNIGLLFALFMFGLVAGSSVGRLICGRYNAEKRYFFLMVSEVMIMILPLLILFCIGKEMHGQMPSLFIYLTLLATSFVTGLQFPLVNQLFGGSAGDSVAITDMADHFGAAIGAIVTGMILVPVMGIAETCFILSAIKMVSFLALIPVMFYCRSD